MAFFNFTLFTYNILWITACSVLLAVYRILTILADIAHFNSKNFQGPDNATFVAQAFLAVQIASILNNVILLMAGTKMLKKTLICTGVLSYLLWESERAMQLQSWFTKLSSTFQVDSPLQNLIHFDSNPVTSLIFWFISTAIIIGRFVWFMGFVWEHDVLVMARNGRALGMKVRNLQLIQSPLTIVVSGILLFTQIRALYNDKIWSTEILEPWYLVTSLTNTTLSLIPAFSFLIDVILGPKQISAAKLERFLGITYLCVHFYTPLGHINKLQIMRIYSSKSATVLTRTYMQNVVTIPLLGNYAILIHHLKNIRNIGQRGDNNFFRVRSILRRKLAVEDKIGEGFTSNVYRGSLKCGSFYKMNIRKLVVAIKVFHPDSVSPNVLMKELQNMARVTKQLLNQKHPHLVKFYGVCFQDSICKPLGTVNIVMELCEKGSLIDCLFKMRGGMSSTALETVSDEYWKQMCTWATEVATGMEYLSVEQGLVHGDLACRNILLDEKLTAKISDFGMSRKLYVYSVYVSTQQTAFPWRHMAPESLSRLEFSQKSDVWSYGVLLFEIFTLGDTPWAEEIWASDFVQGLENGERLSKPRYASDTLYEKAMLKCWNWDSELRPCFTELKLLMCTFVENGNGKETHKPEELLRIELDSPHVPIAPIVNPDSSYCLI